MTTHINFRRNAYYTVMWKHLDVIKQSFGSNDFTISLMKLMSDVINPLHSVHGSSVLAWSFLHYLYLINLNRGGCIKSKASKAHIIRDNNFVNF